MLKINPNPFFWTKAKFSAPDDAGEMTEIHMRVKLSYKDTNEYKQLLEQAAEQPNGQGDLWLAREILQGWGEEVGDLNGQPLAFSPDYRDAFFRAYMPAASAIVRAWVQGQNGAEQGN